MPLQFDRLVGIARNDPALNKEVMDLRAKAESVLVHYRKAVGLRPEHGFSAAAEIIEPAPVLADRHGLSQVLDNLLSNAVKFSPPAARACGGHASRPQAGCAREQ